MRLRIDAGHAGPRREVGEDGPLDHLLHLVGHARHGVDDLVAHRADQAGRGAGRCSMTVAPAGTSAWRRLFSGMRGPGDANMLADHVGQLVVDARASTPITCGDGLAGDVVLGGAEAAADDHRVGPRERLGEHVDDAVVVVADLRLEQVSMPARASCSPIHDELVSTICPSSSSVPIGDDLAAHEPDDLLRGRRRWWPGGCRRSRTARR